MYEKEGELNNMVRCVFCANFTRKTRECSAYLDSKGKPVVIKHIHENMSCPRYKRKENQTK